MMTWNPKKELICPFLPFNKISKKVIILFALLCLIITLDIIGRFRICYLFRNMSNTYFGSSQLFCMNQNYATSHIFANTQKSIPKCQNSLSTEYGYLLRWFQWENCIGLGILVDFPVFFLKTLYFIQ